MTILARRFAIICLMFTIFAMALTMVVESGTRRDQAGLFKLNAPCPQPAGIHCKASL